MKNLILIFVLTITAFSVDTSGEVKKVDVINIVDGQNYGAVFGEDPKNPIEKMQPWIDKQKAKTLECNGWGCSARDVPKFPARYSPVLVIAEYDKDGVPWVKLKADYEISITDITLQHEAKKAAKQARKLEIRQIRQAINLIDASNKPAWEKKILKRLVLELKE